MYKIAKHPGLFFSFNVFYRLVIVLYVLLASNVLLAQVKAPKDTAFIAKLDAMHQALLEQDSARQLRALEQIKNDAFVQAPTDYKKMFFWKYYGQFHELNNRFDTALFYYQKVLKTSLKLQNKEGIAQYVTRTALTLQKLNYSDDSVSAFLAKPIDSLSQHHQPELAVWYASHLSLVVARQFRRPKYASLFISRAQDVLQPHDTIGKINLLQSEAFIRYGLSDFSEAIKLFQESIPLAEQKGLDDELFQALNLVGYIYASLDNFDKSIDYFLQIKKRFEHNEGYYSHACNNLADSYTRIGQYEKARRNILVSLNISKKNKNFQLLYYNYATLAEINQGLQNYEATVQYVDSALALSANNIGQQAYCGNILGEVYLARQQYSKAAKHFNFALGVVEKIHDHDMAMTLYFNLKKLYAQTNNFAKAYQFQHQYYHLRDSIHSAENLSKVNSLNTVLEIERIQQENNNLKTEHQLHEATIEKQQLMQRGLLLVAVVIFMAMVFFIRGNKIKKKANKTLIRQNEEIEHKNKLLEKSKEEIQTQNEQLFAKNEEIQSQNDEILAQQEVLEKQKNLLARKNQEINDSITYARRIQQAVLPSNRRVSECMGSSFVYWKPRDIVSGDFYWVGQNHNKTIVVAADSTGHGVPGAFMSMLGMAFISEIIRSSDLSSPAKILEDLRSGVKTALRQNDPNTEQKDGMDMAMCIIDNPTKKMSYAGAYNSVFVFPKHSPQNVVELKADKQPVGVHYKEKAFTESTYQLQTGDRVYLFSDGFIDQFGGAHGGKYLKRRFKDFLITIQHLPIPQQREAVRLEYHNWTKDKFDQLDDILVMGFEVN